MPKTKKPSKPTRTYLSGKGLQLHPERHAPMDVATPQRLSGPTAKHTLASLEEDLAEVEWARHGAMMRLGDESGFKRFMRPIGAGVAGGAAAYFFPALIEGEQLSITAVIIFILGAVAAVIGHMSLADTEAEIEIQARDYDRERILRVIERLDNVTEHETTPRVEASPAEANPRSWRDIFSRKQTSRT